MSSHHSLQTRHSSGTVFRSRLEGRWAYVFDSLGLEWEYEPRTLHLRSGERYTPDFRVALTDGPLWLEMKPEEPTAGESRRASGAASILGCPVYIVCGVPHPDVQIVRYEGAPTDPARGINAFAECPFCGVVGLTRDGFTIHLPCGCNTVDGVNGVSPRLKRVYANALKASLHCLRHVRCLGEVLPR